MGRARLRRAMEAAGISGGMLARQLGISRSRVSQLLKGAPMNEKQLRLTSELLGISVAEIIYDDPRDFIGSTADMTLDEREVLEWYRGLSKKQRSLLAAWLREMS